MRFHGEYAILAILTNKASVNSYQIMVIGNCVESSLLYRYHIGIMYIFLSSSHIHLKLDKTYARSDKIFLPEELTELEEEELQIHKTIQLCHLRRQNQGLL